jgi:glycosyltransferase involved in cell wall biosynthesis
MKIFLLLSAIPYDKGEAIEVVSHEVVRLMATAGHEVDVQVLIREGWSASSAERERCAAAQFSGASGVRLLSIIYLGDILPRQSRLVGKLSHAWAVVRSLPGFRRWINPYFFSAMPAKTMVRSQVEWVRPDIILSIWSWEALAASYDIPGVPKFVYYGNPNHKPPEAQLLFPDLFDIPVHGVANRIKLQILKLLNKAREIQHLKMMAQCEATANNALIDAQYYTGRGHPRSLYLQNMWPDAEAAPAFGISVVKEDVFRICGSVGNLGATGNTFGLYFLGSELAPRLEALLGRDRLVIDVFGGGRPRTKVAEALKQPSIRLRGWVDDLNTEIRHSCAFLVLTNVYGFNVGNTRILLAWSLGACVIAHTSSALSMPELEHGYNALLGDTAEEIADLVARVAKDVALRENIGRGGYETFQKYYRSEAVVPRMLKEMECTVNEFEGLG